jgi:formylglycine-generating enzyme required for sulfatase activity/tRNA A-37 threonylcarbamoyl transferase component Bud32
MIRAGDKIGPYTLVRRLGRGTFGVVWLAEKRTTLAATKVALKLPNDDDIDLEAVKREASVWVEASGHPNVLPIIDADIYDEQVVIVSEYAPDGSLNDWLKEHGGRAPTIEAAVEMTLGILDGLSHLHARRIIHRDLKPANILLQGRTPRLVDFGLARVLKTTSQSSNVSGTYAYMPPEAFDGKRSEQTDVWSAGVILYQMLTGNLPYPQTDDAALIGALLTREPEPPPDDLPAALREVLHRALQKNPAARYQSVAEMRGALYDALHSNAPQPTALPADAESELPTRKFTAPPAETTIAVPPTVASQQPTASSPEIANPQSEIRIPQSFAPESLARHGGGKLWLVISTAALVIGLVIAASLGMFSSKSGSGNTSVSNQPIPSVSNQPTQSNVSRRPPITNRMGMEFVYVSAGTFIMGSSDADVQRAFEQVQLESSGSARLEWYAPEKPQHQVTIREGFYMGKYEVTQAQWQKVMRNNPSTIKNCDQCPVDNISWDDAQEFIKKLNAKNDGYTYRLPSEAEWEYACRAGTTGDYAGDLDSMAWYYKNSGNETHPVGQKQPNAWGLYDMHGNVEEWCEDIWHESYNGAPTDGSVWISGGDPSRQVLRGGSWFSVAVDLRSAFRLRGGPRSHGSFNGFRVVAVSRAS